MEISVGLFFAQYKVVLSAMALLIIGKVCVCEPPLSCYKPAVCICVIFWCCEATVTEIFRSLCG